MGVFVGEWHLVPVPRGKLPEGCRWLRDQRCFQWVDILRPSVMRWSPYLDPDHVEVRELPLEFATVALPLGGHQVIADRNTLYRYSWESGSLDVLLRADFASDVRFNDGHVDPTGRVFIATMSMSGRQAAGALYRVEGDELVEVVPAVGIGNGLAWISDSEALFVDSLRGTVSRLKNLEGSAVPSSETWVEFTLPDEPDGLSVTPAGNVLIALWRGSRVVALDKSGESVATLNVPASFPTSVTVGGDAGEVVMVTTAAHTEAGVPAGHADGHVLWAEYEEI